MDLGDKLLGAKNIVQKFGELDDLKDKIEAISDFLGSDAAKKVMKEGHEAKDKIEAISDFLGSDAAKKVMKEGHEAIEAVYRAIKKS